MGQERCQVINRSRVTSRVDGSTLRSLLLPRRLEDGPVYDYGRFFPSTGFQQLQDFDLSFTHARQTIPFSLQNPLQIFIFRSIRTTFFMQDGRSSDGVLLVVALGFDAPFLDAEPSDIYISH